MFMRATCLCLSMASLFSSAADAQTEPDGASLRAKSLLRSLEADRFNQLRTFSAMGRDLEPQLPAAQRLALARAASREFQNPSLAVPGSDGVIVLEVDYGDNVIGNASPSNVHLRSYNGALVGPTIRAKAGDDVRVRIVNRLSAEPAGTHPANGHHDWNTTNLHTHGLHVRPNRPAPDPESDNVLLEIPPGATQEYLFEIPADHPAGTFWYHGHKHGSTSAHVSSGMSGALLISRTNSDLNRGNIDIVPEVQDAMQTVTVGGTAREREKVMVLQQIPFIVRNGVGQLELADANAAFGPGTWHASGRHTTINGQLLPVITFSPGEIQRWRLIHSGLRELLRLQIEKDPDPAIGGTGPGHLELHQLAVDGLPLRRVDSRPEIELWPGYRSDVLVQAPLTTGTYYLIDATSSSADSLLGEPEPLKFIAKVVIANEPQVTMSLPTNDKIEDHRLTSLTPPAGTTPAQEAYYGIVSGQFVIGDTDPGVGNPVVGSPFNPANTRTLVLGTTDRWRIGTRNGSGIGATHPFHIHVNPFEIISIKDPTGRETLTESVWRDTIAMPQGYTIEFLTRYETFVGEFVQHCHILDHEDRGMMEKVAIIAPPSSTASPSPLAVASDVQGAESGVSGPRVLVFVKGSFCPHCMAQLTELARTVSISRIPVTVISAGSNDDLKNFPNLPYTLLADPDLKLFRQFGVLRDGPLHGTIVLNRQSELILREIGEEPFLDRAALEVAVARVASRVVLAVRKTDSFDDDYLTWAPAASEIRIENGNPGDADLTVTLTNDDPSTIPTGGDVRFAATLPAGETAKLESLTLTLKQDGTPVELFIAGSKASELTATSLADKGRDAVIEIHEGPDATGPLLTSQAAMVRVRKSLETVNDLERDALLQAITDLHIVRPDGRDLYLELLEIHTLAGKGLADPPPMYPDQAHKGPGFLAWHRAFLLQFERELQKLDPTVALHYWQENHQPAPGVPSPVFTDLAWGANSLSPFLVPVTLAPGNPLFGWQIFGDPLERRGRDRAVISGFKTESNIVNYPRFRDENTGDAFSENVERNPHNFGHGWVGGWMASCQTSPSDPVFWVFHCDNDRLWANWQATHGMFGTTGSNPLVYEPNDAYAAGSSTPLGHHLLDTMWPWDGVTGAGAPGDPNDNRPPPPPRGMFETAPLPGLWPPADAKPRPADIIDYLGIEDRSHDLGYCYDAIPYGRISSSAPPLLAASAVENAVDSTVSWTKRRAALQSLLSAPSAERARLSKVLQSQAEADTLRSDALHVLLSSRTPDLLSQVLKVLRDPDDGGPELKVAAAQAAVELVMFHAHATDRHGEVDSVLATIARSGDGDPRRAALEGLAVMQADAARDIAAEQLASDAPWLPVPDAIALFRRASAGRIDPAPVRRHLSSRDPDARSAAAEALGGDSASRVRCLEMLLDADEPTVVRRGAIKGLMYGDPGFPAAALRVASNANEDVELRRTALAGLLVYARENPSIASQHQVAEWITQIRPLESSPIPSLRSMAVVAIRTLERLAARRG